MKVFLSLTLCTLALAQLDVKRLNLLAEDIPERARIEARSSEADRRIETGNVDVDVRIQRETQKPLYHLISQGVSVFYERSEATSRAYSAVLFLLHGAAFNTKTWSKQTRTLQALSSAGFDVVAVNLPGEQCHSECTSYIVIFRQAWNEWKSGQGRRSRHFRLRPHSRSGAR